MTIASREPGIDIGDFTGQPLPVGNGHHSVLLAVHEQHRNAKLTQVETPGHNECDVIINNAIPSLPDSLMNAAEHEIGKACC